MVFEEIVKSNIMTSLFTILLISTFVTVCTCVLMLKYHNSRVLSNIVITAVFMFIGFGVIAIVVIATDTWSESVQEQVNNLECEDLELAYEVYGFEYIKEKYAVECTGQPVKEWWEQ